MAAVEVDTVPTVERTLSSDSNDEDFLDFTRQLTKALAITYTVSATESDLMDRGHNGTLESPQLANSPINQIVGRLNVYADEINRRMEEKDQQQNEPAAPQDNESLADLIQNYWTVGYDLFESVCSQVMRKYRGCFQSCRDQVVFVISSASRILDQLQQDSNAGDTSNREQQIGSFPWRFIQRNFRGAVSSQRGLEEMLSNTDTEEVHPFIDVD